MRIKSSYDFKYNLLLALLTGIILGFSFPPFQFGMIAIIGFVPLLILFDSIDTYKKAFRYSYFAFFIFNLVSCYWVGGFGYESDIFLMISGVALAFYHPFVYTIPMVFFFLIRKNLGKNMGFLSLPFLWVAFEYFHSMTEFAFPWILLGNSQTYNIYNIQYITYTGVYGISFWIVSINILIYLTYSKMTNDNLTIFSIKSILMVTAVIIFYFIPEIISNYILSDYEYNKNKVKVAILQPNIDPWEKWKKTKEFDQVQELLQMTKSVMSQNKPDLIIWPETAIPFYIKLPSRAFELETIKHQIDSLGINLISGAADLKIYRDGEEVPPSSKKSKSSDFAWDSYNSIFLFQPYKEKMQVYHKIKLVPFSERIPYLDTYPFLVNFLEWGVGISNWGIGKDSTVFNFKKSITNETKNIEQNKNDSVDIKFWSMICYESIFPGFVSEFVNKGAQFLIIVTNDSWFGNSSGPYQHNQFAVLRAIENRRSIARCANGGISSIIDPTGRMIYKTKFSTKDIIVGDIDLNNELTFYSKHGDIFSRICLYISLIFIAAVIFVRIIKIKNKYSRYKNELNN